MFFFKWNVLSLTGWQRGVILEIPSGDSWKPQRKQLTGPESNESPWNLIQLQQSLFLLSYDTDTVAGSEIPFPTTVWDGAKTL